MSKWVSVWVSEFPISHVTKNYATDTVFPYKLWHRYTIYKLSHRYSTYIYKVPRRFSIYIDTVPADKNAAKRTRQHAGRVSWPHSNINVKLCTSRLCMKKLSFLFVCAWALPRILYLSCGVSFPVWTPDNISGLISVVLWLLRWEVIKKKFR